MFYYSDNQLDTWLLDDINLGDLTTRGLGIGKRPGRMSYSFRQTTRASGLAVAERLLQKLGLQVERLQDDGQDCAAGTPLIVAEGSAERLHLGWKVSQNIIEWASGVAACTARMVLAGQSVNPNLRLACTRKSVPGTKVLAHAAVLHGGGIIHRGGTAETILLFANHRCFTDNPEDFAGHIARLKRAAPEKKIIVEADSLAEARLAVKGSPDILQLDKFSLEEAREVVALAHRECPACLISAAGGINADNISGYAAAGAGLVVSSAPYYARPADVKVRMEKI